MNASSKNQALPLPNLIITMNPTKNMSNITPRKIPS